MDDAFEQTASFFDGLVRQHGPTFAALDYGSEASQRTRFDVLAAAADFDGASVLDVGSGLADLADYLESRFAGVRYTGIDLSSEMVDAARLRRPDLDLRHGTVFGLGGESFDIVVANGIFYLLGEDAERLMHDLVKRMWELCRQAVVFTSLSTWHEMAETDEFSADPLATLEFCRTLTPRLSFRHDYLPQDFAVVLRRA